MALIGRMAWLWHRSGMLSGVPAARAFDADSTMPESRISRSAFTSQSLISNVVDRSWFVPAGVIHGPGAHRSVAEYTTLSEISSGNWLSHRRKWLLVRLRPGRSNTTALLELGRSTPRLGRSGQDHVG